MTWMIRILMPWMCTINYIITISNIVVAISPITISITAKKQTVP